MQRSKNGTENRPVWRPVVKHYIADFTTSAYYDPDHVTKFNFVEGIALAGHCGV